MGLGLTILVALVIITAMVLGYFRDVRRAIIALAGTMFGIVLVTHWATPTVTWLAKVSGGNPNNLIGPISILIFLATVAVIGYGSPMLLGGNAVSKAMPLQRRLINAALGFVNGVLISGSLLRYFTLNNSAGYEEVSANPLTNYLYAGLPLLFLAFATILAVLVAWKASHLVIKAQSVASKPAAKAEEKKEEKPAAPATATPATAGAEKK